MNVDELSSVLTESQRLGFLGARPIDEVIEHASGFVTALDDVTGTVVDLGSGGGVPGLVIACARPDLEIVLVDRRSKRTDFLMRMVRRHRISDRVQVISADTAELVSRRGATFDAAVARGFGPPHSTLEVGLSLVRPGGLVVISEPPEGDRWSTAVVRAVGATRRDDQTGVAVFERRADPH